MLEALTGFETPNTYKVYQTDEHGSKTRDDAMFEAKEKSGWCMRMFCPGAMRGFEMKVKGKKGNKNEFLHIDRPFKCTCFCCNRPEM